MRKSKRFSPGCRIEKTVKHDSGNEKGKLSVFYSFLLNQYLVSVIEIGKSKRGSFTLEYKCLYGLLLVCLV